MKSLNRSSVATGLLFLLALALMSPALFAGFMGDDFIHQALFKPGLPISLPDDASLFGLFSFMDADPGRNKELMNLGLLPWWTFPEMKYAFWRPLSELSHGLDYLLWPGNAVMMHAHSILWYFALCYLVYRLYRYFYQSLPSYLLLTGFALYLLDSSHGFALSWIANRNGLIAATFGMASILCYVKSHDQNILSLKLASIGLLGLALFSAEIGISTVGYFGAYALFIDKRNTIRSCLSVLPHILLVILWWILYKSLDFGAANAVGYYLDPVAAPLDFLATLAQRIVVLFGSQWGLIPAEVYGFSGTYKLLANVLVVIASVVVLLVIMILAPLLARSKRARFWLVGALFSALPVCAALPHDRLLLFIGVGAMGIFLELFNEANNRDPKPNLWQTLTNIQPGYRKVMLMVFLGLHLLISPLLLTLTAYSPKVWAKQIDMSPARLSGLEDLDKKQLVLFNVPIASSTSLSIWRFNQQLPIPERVWPISNHVSKLHLVRVADNALVVAKEGGFIQMEETGVRDLASQPFKQGDQVTLSGLNIEVLQVSKSGQPVSIKTTFNKSLDDEELVFMSWDVDAGEYEVIEMPTIGGAISLN